MDQTNQLNKNFLIIVFVVVVATLAAGYYFGAATEKTKAAESRAALVKEIFGPALSIGNVFGEIIEISSDKKSFIIEAPNMFQVNLPAEYRRKIITLVPETKITLYEQKNPDVFAKEMEEYAQKQKIAKNGSSLSRPIPVIEKEINPDGLRVGDMASVIFSPEFGKNFLDSELTAVSISVSR